MHLELLYKIEYVCRIPNGFGMKQALTQLVVKILFDDSTGFNEMRWTIFVARETEIMDIVYDLRLALGNWFKPSSKIFLLTVPRRYFFCGSFMLFLPCICFAFVRICLCVPCGHLLGND